MDLEKQLEIQRKETSSALRILLGYADKMDAKNLDKNRESLEQLKKFSLNMAQFFCVEGHEHGCDERRLAWLKMKKKGVINANDAILNHIYREGVQGALTGIRDVDARMILSNQSFTLVAGVSGTKKTDYLLGIARYNVAQGKRVLFINLKNSAEELAIRLLSIGSQVPVRNILLNQMTEEDWNRITQSLSAGKDNEILFYNSNNDYLQFIKEIKNKIRRQRVSVVLNLCNRLWHKFLGERIACYWISWTARRAVFGMPTKPSKMAGAVQYWNYRFRVV